MSHDTNEEIRADIERMKKQIAADRKARGLEGVPIPDKFVDGDASVTLIKRCNPLEQFAIRYTQLCDEANEILPLSEEQAEWVGEHREYADLLRESVDQSLMSYGIGLQLAVELLLADEGHEHKQAASIFIRQMFQAIQLLTLTYDTYEIKTGVYKELPKKVFNKRYEELIQHYKTIKHLY